MLKKCVFFCDPSHSPPHPLSPFKLLSKKQFNQYQFHMKSHPFWMHSHQVEGHLLISSPAENLQTLASLNLGRAISTCF